MFNGLLIKKYRFMEVAFSVNYAHHLKQYTYSYIMYRTLCQVHTVQSQSYLKTTENTEEPAWNLSLKKIRISPESVVIFCDSYHVLFQDYKSSTAYWGVFNRYCRKKEMTFDDLAFFSHLSVWSKKIKCPVIFG